MGLASNSWDEELAVISCNLRPCLAQEPPAPQWPPWPPWQGLVKPAPNLYCFPAKKLQDFTKKRPVQAKLSGQHKVKRKLMIKSKN
jgi:hypothetical protein